ncbi:hypothetical protein IQ22_03480 [Pseudomonas duriflava]|uniref:Uncharacterized protein n=1 Tax=Pseudomonas duriflava TaxID=459528 RepID=A0A562Q6G8_9PSED|nr:hypothetical protein [Pseudomonas duriflava]TWI52337.1 hypothetical protein IQ22_03480 [Pseudomonas duriflava]
MGQRLGGRLQNSFDRGDKSALSVSLIEANGHPSKDVRRQTAGLALA